MKNKVRSKRWRAKRHLDLKAWLAVLISNSKGDMPTDGELDQLVRESEDLRPLSESISPNNPGLISLVNEVWA